jgi:hypothetical protein
MTRERRKGRAHRLAATTLPAVLSRGGYAHAQHSREREDARRRRQMARPRPFLVLAEISS